MKATKLTKKRTVVRKLITELLTDIELFYNNNEITDDVKSEGLEDFKEDLEMKSAELKTLDEDIENVTPETEIEKEVEESQDFQKNIVVWLGRIRRFLKKTHQEKTLIEEKEVVIKTAPEPKLLNLPRLQIETFYGDSLKWLDFWNQFEGTIHNNSDLRKTEKFAYLKSLLGGSALSSITGFALSDENYDSAVDILCSRFGKPNVVIGCHMNKLLAVEAVRSTSNVKGLRKLYDECEIQIRSLNSLQVKCGNVLCPIILQKIPEELNIDFNRSRKTENQEYDINELLDYLKKEINCREAASLFKERKPPENSPMYETKGKPSYNYRPRPATASALSVSKKSFQCIFCDQNHNKFYCVVLNAQQKRQFLMERGRCFICFGLRHISSQCKNKKFACRKCSGFHNESICISHQNPENSEGNETEVIQNSSSRSGSDILLQTVNALAVGPKKNIYLKVLIDGGSQVSAIRQDLSRRLNLPVKCEKELNIYSFGEKKGRKSLHKIVELKLRNVNDPEKTITLDLMEVPVITSAEIKIPDQEIRKQLWARGITLSEIQPLESVPSDAGVGVLLGADHGLYRHPFVKLFERRVRAHDVIIR